MKQELYKEKLKLTEIHTEDEKSFINICCPSCSTDIPAENININDKIAKCNSCAAIFPFQNELNVFTTPKSTGDQEVLRPEGIDVFNFKHLKEIVVIQPAVGSDYLPHFIFPLPFFIFFMLSLIYTSPLYISLTLITLIIPIVFHIIYSKAKKNHKVHIEIDKETLAIMWRPKKMNADRFYNLKDIKQLYVKGQQLYMIVDGMEGSKHTPLIPNLISFPQVHFLEQEIESHLGIINEPMVGEDQ